jgi:hypothetical protein
VFRAFPLKKYLLLGILMTGFLFLMGLYYSIKKELKCRIIKMNPIYLQLEIYLEKTNVK